MDETNIYTFYHGILCMYKMHCFNVNCFQFYFRRLGDKCVPFFRLGWHESFMTTIFWVFCIGFSNLFEIISVPNRDCPTTTCSTNSFS